jgi:hypothetical protein
MATRSDAFGLHPVSNTSTLAPDQARSLDDAFFTSNPAAYWRARIDSLLREPSPIDYSAGLASELGRLGLDPRILTSTEPNEREREMQRGLDAFALRHHVAESLVRLVRATVEAAEDHDVSVWALLADDKSKGIELVKEVQARVQEGVPVILFLPPAQAPTSDDAIAGDLEIGVRTHWRWVQRSMDLLVGDGLDANAGHNKLKHGFAVRGRDDLRVALSTTPPNADGSVRESTLQDAMQLVDAPVVEFLEKLPKRHSHAGSWETTVLNLRPRELLAEALLITIVWSSVFASAAARRFVGRDVEPPAHPGLLLGPAPDAVVRGAVGFRQGLTKTTVGGDPRPFTIGTLKQTMTLAESGDWSHGVVVDG